MLSQHTSRGDQTATRVGSQHNTFREAKRPVVTDRLPSCVVQWVSGTPAEANSGQSMIHCCGLQQMLHSAGAMACMGMSIFGALFMGGMALMLKNDYQ